MVANIPPPPNYQIIVTANTPLNNYMDLSLTPFTVQQFNIISNYILSVTNCSYEMFKIFN